jgi:hypothetical protein
MPLYELRPIWKWLVYVRRKRRELWWWIRFRKVDRPMAPGGMYSQETVDWVIQRIEQANARKGTDEPH